MYNDEIQESTISSLEEKVVSIVNTNLALLSQGYLVNRNKYTKLNWSSILIDAFENINVFSVEQQNNIERVYNKVMAL